ncbi:glycosyltransferase family 4 protein [uncultured Pseudokineococcus sp.]|uniref:glycosyltransferase family 4 protein n=1 Tax=uncultured Pseudokineococcus sp. TaxID=1642928 RepID=UPI002628916A|nr:glycosyltransferase family 4 protein [uncultured Pseudokineococcus sp.]
MDQGTDRAAGRSAREGDGPPGGLVLASRGDALTPYLFAAVGRRYDVAAHLSPELTRIQRLAVAATTFRPRREDWAERFYKSSWAYALRSSNAVRRLERLAAPSTPVLQVHALFEVAGAPTLLYVDCTHRQSAEGWAPWNPLAGADLEAWYARERAAYRGAEHLFAFSRATRTSLVEDYGVDPARVSVVGAGVNAHELPAPAARRAPGSRGPVLLFIGNDFERKGGHLLLQAFERVREVHPGARLQLVGTRPSHLDVPPGVEVLGRVHERAVVHRLYEEADLFVLPSLFDPFPLVLIEAMAHGLPVVTSDSCGIPDMLTDGVEGRIGPRGDVDALTDALVRTLADPAAAAAAGRAGRRRVVEELTWDRVVERMAPALDLALGESSRRSPSS